MLPFVLSLPALSVSKGRRAGYDCIMRKSYDYYKCSTK